MAISGALPDFMEELSDALATIAVGDPSEVKKSKKWPLSTIASDRLASKVLASQYWRPENEGRSIKLKLKFYYANRPCRFQKWL